MNKLKQLKQAMANPPPQRLAAVEYRSHFMQLAGILFASIFLLIKGFWYIIFAFIFGIGVSYSQGMGAYNKWKMIMTMVEPEKMEDYGDDKSPTRRRSKIIKSVFGNKAKWVCIILSVIVAVLIVDPTMSRWLLMLIYPCVILVVNLLLYFLLCFWIANPIYKKRVAKLKLGKDWADEFIEIMKKEVKQK